MISALIATNRLIDSMKLRPASEEKKKLIANIYTPLVNLLDYKINKSLLKRDAYLDFAIANEIEHLDKEVVERNSDRAFNYIFQAMKRENTNRVSLNLSITTIKRLNEVCEAKNIPRDAFINRLVFFMTIINDKAISAVISVLADYVSETYDIFFYSPSDVDVEGVDGVEYKWFRPNIFDALSECVRIEPLLYIRGILNMEYKSHPKKEPFNIYTYPIKQGNPLSDLEFYKDIKDLSGLNVTLTDEYVEIFEEKDILFKKMLGRLIEKAEQENGRLKRDLNSYKDRAIVLKQLDALDAEFEGLDLP